MIRSLLTLHPLGEDSAAVIGLYRTEQILQESLDLTRAISSEISVAIDGSHEILVSAVWPDEAAYQEWLDHPRRDRTGPELRMLLRDAEIGAARLFRIDHAVTTTP